MKHAKCHPTRQHEARGMCTLCYRAWYYARNKEKCAEMYRRWKKENPDKVKAQLARRNYAGSYFKFGLTATEYREMAAKYNGVCPICNRTDSRRLSVDHCHTTGKIRGMLCNTCNIGLGKFRDNPMWLRNAALYLEGTLFHA